MENVAPKLDQAKKVLKNVKRARRIAAVATTLGNPVFWVIVLTIVVMIIFLIIFVLISNKANENAPGSGKLVTDHMDVIFDNVLKPQKV